jgi:chorismate mutase
MEQKYLNKLEDLRKQIDVVDMELYVSVFNRIILTTEIGRLKKQYGVVEMSIERRKEIIDKFSQMAMEDTIPVYIVKDIFTKLIDLSVLEQTLIINEKEHD